MIKFFESMTNVPIKIQDKDFVIRVWRSEDRFLFQYDNDDIRQTIYSSRGNCLASEVELIIENVSNLPRVSAIEILDKHKCGIVAYVEW